MWYELLTGRHPFAEHASGGTRRINGVVAMSPYLVRESAVASAVLARMTVGSEDEALPYLRRVVDAQQTLQEWADVSELQSAQKDHQLLGAHHRTGALVMEPGTGHFDLEGARCIGEHLHSVVEQLRTRALT